MTNIRHICACSICSNTCCMKILLVLFSQDQASTNDVDCLHQIIPRCGYIMTTAMNKDRPFIRLAHAAEVAGRLGQPVMGPPHVRSRDRNDLSPHFRFQINHPTLLKRVVTNWRRGRKEDGASKRDRGPLLEAVNQPGADEGRGKAKRYNAVKGPLFLQKCPQVLKRVEHAACRLFIEIREWPWFPNGRAVKLLKQSWLVTDHLNWLSARSTR